MFFFRQTTKLLVGTPHITHTYAAEYSVCAHLWCVIFIIFPLLVVEFFTLCVYSSLRLLLAFQDSFSDEIRKYFTKNRREITTAFSAFRRMFSAHTHTYCVCISHTFGREKKLIKKNNVNLVYPRTSRTRGKDDIYIF